MSDETPNPLGPISEMVKVLKEPINNTVVPVTKEVGEFLGMIANLGRFYATENMAKVFTKWAEYRRGERPLNGDDVRKVMPLLPAASMVSDDELQARWARIMESAVNDDSHAPSFGQTLSQLSAEQVRFLDTAWAVVSDPTDYTRNYSPTMRPISFARLIRAFDSQINPGVNYAEFKVHGDKWTKEQHENYEELQAAQLTIDNIVRLRVLRENQKFREQKRVVGVEAVDESRNQVTLEAAELEVHTDYAFSVYGVAFMKAVTGQK